VTSLVPQRSARQGAPALAPAAAGTAQASAAAGKAAPAAAPADLSSTVSYLQTAGTTGGIVRVTSAGTTTAPDGFTGNARAVAWSGDGSRYAYSTSAAIVSRRAANADSPVTVDGSASLGPVAWHPRGYEVAGTVSAGGQARVLLAKSDGTYRWVADGNDADGNPVAGARLPVDPSTLTYLPDEVSLAVTAKASGLRQIQHFDTRTQVATRILPEHSSADDPGVEQRDPVLSPEGDRLAYVQEAANETQSVWVMNTDGSDAAQVATVNVAGGGLGWTPDGLALYVLGTNSGAHSLKLVTVSDGTTTTLASLPAADSVSSLSVRPNAATVVGERLAGSDRITTAIAVSRGGFVDKPVTGDPSCAEYEALAVVLVRSDLFPDGLVAGPLAARKCAPLLLTPPTSLDARVLTEIKRVLKSGRTVHVVGSTGAISTATEKQIKSAGYSVVRYAGADRYATAAQVARVGLGKPSTVFLASGQNFPDALVAGSAATAMDAAILLTAGSAPAAATNAYIQEVTDPRGAAVGVPAATAYPWAYRVAGADRYATAAKVATEYFYPPRVAFLANGATFPDAMSGGAMAALTGNPLLITAPTALAAPVSTLLDAASAATSFVVAFGGPAVVSDAVVGKAVTFSGGAEPWLANG
jgi:putative cell wall-binding protein